MPSPLKSTSSQYLNRINRTVEMKTRATPKKQASRSNLKKRTLRSTRVAIIGGGQGGKALMEIFAQDPLAQIVAMAEVKSKAPGADLAKKFGVPVAQDYRELLKMKNIDLIIDVTGNPLVERVLQKVHRSNLAIIGGPSAKFMWQLIDARIRAISEIEKNLMRYQSLFHRYVKEEAESAVDEERTRIAYEIHDGLVQTLVGLNLKMERCGELIEQEPEKCLVLMKEGKKQLKHGIQEAREVVFNLRPGQYEQLDLMSALSSYLRSYEKQNGVQVDFVTSGGELNLDSKTKVFVFRIVQEALSNAHKHAKATRVSVHLAINLDMLTGFVRDNGIGFDVQAVSKDPEKWGHFGLRGMKERARLLGGEAQWESIKGQGTTVAIKIPVIRKGKV